MKSVLVVVLGLGLLFSQLSVAGPSVRALARMKALGESPMAPGRTYRVGYSRIMEYSLDQITGLKLPSNWRQKAHFYTVTAPTPLPKSFDWRVAAHGLTPIKDQGGCGSCWAFATVSVFESILKIRFHVSKSLSEQQLVDCDQNSSGCGGGYFAHDIHVNVGAAPTDEYPYQGSNGICHQKSSYPEKLASWGYVGGSSDATPTVDQIKAAIYQYGPVATVVTATGEMQGYSGGIFNSCFTLGDTNHMVSLVGWNDDGGYWIMRNSWGADWGEDGYMRIKYGCANIGQQATFVVLPEGMAARPVGK